ncbi:MAG: thymidine phosphorylase [Verrucomicrobia bacterium]|nr:thymidine phosphorylase [Verrucomicrobiota bacterium]
MHVPSLIEKKRDGGILSDSELQFLIAGFTRGTIPDYQMSALAMAVYFRGMNFAEAVALTAAMRDSGEALDCRGQLAAALGRPMAVVDKHSTGGVGDKTSLVVAPLVAACGVAVPMISGRGLGPTGGTLDKLESIPGFRVDLTKDEFLAQLGAVGVAMIGQTEQIAPADRKLYALRDVTATVPSLPLITASIMSKKLAEGLDGLVLDVKWGGGAFMREQKQARELAEWMVRVGQQAGVRTAALLTDMNQPLGAAVGNALEVREAIETLRGGGPADLRELCLALAEEMLALAGVEGGRALLEERIASGAAMAKFEEMVAAQGGTSLDMDAQLAPLRADCAAADDGCVQRMDCARVGLVSMLLGAGRAKVSDAVDHGVGIEVLKKIGDGVQRGEPLARIYARDEGRLAPALEGLAACYEIGPEPVEPPRLILEAVR